MVSAAFSSGAALQAVEAVGREVFPADFFLGAGFFFGAGIVGKDTAASGACQVERSRE